MRRALLAVLPLTLLLSGCIMPPFGMPGPAPIIPGETLMPEDPEACASGEFRITDPGEYRIGRCDALMVEGSDIEVIADELGVLTIRGDDNEVGARTVGIATIEGQSNQLESGDLGSLTIRGDDNDVEVSGSIGVLTVAGNDNEVTARGSIGTVQEDGRGNEISG